MLFLNAQYNSFLHLIFNLFYTHKRRYPPCHKRRTILQISINTKRVYLYFSFVAFMWASHIVYVSFSIARSQNHTYPKLSVYLLVCTVGIECVSISRTAKWHYEFVCVWLLQKNDFNIPTKCIYLLVYIQYIHNIHQQEFSGDVVLSASGWTTTRCAREWFSAAPSGVETGPNFSIDFCIDPCSLGAPFNVYDIYAFARLSPST